MAARRLDYQYARDIADVAQRAAFEELVQGHG